ncbi:glutamine synthetase [Devosia limi DSM 17137]|uniref:Glutamine synthetase n=1 Tax=Devosia limi DSM 17137 TaxID=1121477 RepID=A0A0F5L4F1_9HYPH|nr:glutamine synthetase family protein [Devosia limi]KKB77069.1 glutamine synthetase [Devosia limi DSM 17137]SHF41507.1 glutamine synthetase [Devosia limi DSM 17137]
MAAYSLEALREDVGAGRIDTVLVAFPDMQGRMIGKRLQAEYFLDTAHDETHGCDYLLADDIDMEPVPGYTAANWGKGYGDFVMKPDLTTLMKATWLEGTAIVLCDLTDHHHEPLPHSPRAILKHQIERLAAMGYTANAATELEFYLFDDDYRTVHDKGHRNLTTSGYYIEDYHIFQTTKEEGVMRQLRKHLQASGIPVESSKGEWGPGQEEINIRYADALTMADRHVVLKNATKEIAYGQGKAVTFMAKWDFGLAGSSSHIHMSLADKAGKPMFVDAKDERGMSELMKHFMAGQLAYARDITYFLAPYINSYKRYQAGTFAPTKAIWSPDNRTAGFRLCGEHSKAIRVECRMGGADLNPYLAIAALIAAGIRGIEDKLPLEPAFVGDAYLTGTLREIPKTLREATEMLQNSTMLREAFGTAAIEHYVHTAEWEQFEYDRRVTDWELKRGFERS